jgi:hypothetical protein
MVASKCKKGINCPSVAFLLLQFPQTAATGPLFLVEWQKREKTRMKTHKAQCSPRANFFFSL